MDKLSLTATAREQLRKAAQAPSRRAAETVYGGHDRTLRQTVIALVAGTTLAEQENPGEATVHVLAGRVSGWAADAVQTAVRAVPAQLAAVAVRRHRSGARAVG